MVTEVYPLVASQRRGIQANYYLALGKDVKHLEVPVKAILDKHLTTLINAWRLVDDDAKEEAMMRDLNIRALQCITDIKAKLVLFGEAHPTYRAVAGERIETSYDTNRYVRCGFVLCSQFTDKPKQPSAWRLWDSEIKLNIGIGEPGYKLETTQSYLFVLNPRITRAYYFLELGKDVKHLEAPIKDIIETRLKQFHDQVEKMR